MDEEEKVRKEEPNRKKGRDEEIEGSMREVHTNKVRERKEEVKKEG